MITSRALPLLALLAASVGLVGHLVMGVAGAAVSLAAVSALAVLAARNGQTLLLAWLDARPAPDGPEADAVRARLADVARRAGVPTPELWTVPSEQINAFALARPGGAVVCLTRGFTAGLSPEQQEAMLALQVARIRNGAAADATLGAVAAGALAWTSSLGLAARTDADPNPFVVPSGTVVAPFAALLTRLVRSSAREREALRDAGRYPGRRDDLLRGLERAEFTAHADPLPVPASLQGTALVTPHPRTPPTSLARLYGHLPSAAERQAWLSAPEAARPERRRRTAQEAA